MELSKDELRKIKSIKDLLHKNPETSFEEYETTKIIKNYFKNLKNISEIKLGLKTGAVFILKSNFSNKDTKTIALRADIDAINQNESTYNKIRSCKEGVMHGCGHDFHTAALLGAATILDSSHNILKNNIVFIFQPAEEITKGAEYLIDKKLFEKTKIDSVIGLHNRPELEAGKVVVKETELMSNKCNITVTINGRGGHGSNPEKNIDPIICAANIINSLQSIVSRNVSPLDSAVLSVNYISGGDVNNLVVDSVTFKITIRALKKTTYKRLLDRTKSIIINTSKAYECKHEIYFDDIIDGGYNSKKMTKKAFSTAKMVVGEKNILTKGFSLASEDFSKYSKYADTFFYWVGAGFKDFDNRPWHDPMYKTNDKAIEIAAKIYAQSALTF